MVPAGNKAKHFSLVNHTTKTIHHNRHQRFLSQDMKKMNCPAKIILPEVVFLEFKVTFIITFFTTDKQSFKKFVCEGFKRKMIF